MKKINWFTILKYLSEYALSIVLGLVMASLCYVWFQTGFLDIPPAWAIPIGFMAGFGFGEVLMRFFKWFSR